MSDTELFTKLLAKCETFPLYVGPSDPPDSVLYDWLDEDDDVVNGPWVDVPGLDLRLWGSRYDMRQRVEDAIDDFAIGADQQRVRVRPLEQPGQAPPHPRLPYLDPGDPNYPAWSAYWLMEPDELDATFQLRDALAMGTGLISSNEDVRAVLVKLRPRIVSQAETDDLLAVARPPVTRWAAPGTDWTIRPNVGDINKARNP